MQSSNFRRDDFVSSFRSSAPTPGLVLPPTPQWPQDAGPPANAPPALPAKTPLPNAAPSRLTEWKSGPQPPRKGREDPKWRLIFLMNFMVVLLIALPTWMYYHPTPDAVLIQAAQDGNLAQAKIALGKGANVDAECGCARTALSWASKNGHIAVASLLISKGADVNLVDRHRDSALTMAAANRHADIVALLVAHHADVNQINDEDGTALWSAVQHQQIDMARMLLAHDANANAIGTRGWTLLMEATRNGSLPLVKMLLAHEANVDAHSLDGHTAYGEALLLHREDIAAALSAEMSPEATAS